MCPCALLQEGFTCLIKAAENGHLDVVTHLVEKGANFNFVTTVGCSILQ